MSKSEKKQNNGMNKVLVVGGGLTSAVTCSLLSELSAVSKRQLDLTVWDKARGVGGRMSTSRSAKNKACSVDLGAQYITATEEYASKHKNFYDELIKDDLFKPLLASEIEGMKCEPGKKVSGHFVTPNGVSSIVKFHFDKSGAKLNFGRHVNNLTKSADDKNWLVETQTGERENFDTVVLTMPVPQLLQLPGFPQDFFRTNPDITSKLESVRYSSRYALGLFFNKPVDLKTNFKVAQYVDTDPIIRFVSIDNVKRGLDAEASPTSVVFHTSVPFGVEHVEKTPDEVKPVLIQKVKDMYPDWPEADEIKCQKWRYSQVSEPFSGSPGCLVLNKVPLLVAGGDGFTHSNFDGCVSSAEQMVNEVKSRL